MSTRTALDRILAFDTRPPLVGWAALAISFHIGLGAVLARRAIAAPVETKSTEAEFVPLDPPEPPPPLDPSPSPSPSPSPAVAQVAVASKPQPALGKAAPVLTAKSETEPTKDEPTSFVSDPDGKEFGSGLVGKGGTAERGEKDGKPAVPFVAPVMAAPAKPAATLAITPPSNLSRAPKLEGGDPCRGFFPAAADDDSATVAVSVVVRADGSVATANVVKESVTGQGFAKAARSCLLSTKFSPALDVAGNATGAAATVNVHFAR